MPAPVAAAGAGSGGLAGLIKVLTGAGVSNPVAASVFGSTIANTTPALVNALLGQGGALRTNTQALTTGTPAKFTITAQDVLALEQFAARENFRRAFLPGSKKVDVNEILDDTAKRLNEQLNQATLRKMEELRVQGELAALPNLMTSIGNIGSAQSRIAETGLGKVLESALPAAYIGQVAAPRQITI